MGAWGTGAFENDGACDWLYELEVGGPDLLDQAFALVLEHEAEDESFDAEIGLAAAEIVASLLGRPPEDLTEIGRLWVERFPEAATEERILKARDAVKLVLEESELAELWDESEEGPAWRERTEGLLQRLS